MKKKTVLFLSFVLSFSALAFAQKKTVTNEDLEKFKQQRLQAEKNYRENYERLGFPSPEELERKRIEDEQNIVEFSQQLETQRLQREAIQADLENQSLFLQQQNQYQPVYSNSGSGYGYGGYLPFYGNFYNYRNNRGYRGYGNNRPSYDSSTFQRSNPYFFNLQVPPPRPPQKLYAPGTRTNNPPSGMTNPQQPVRPGRRN